MRHDYSDILRTRPSSAQKAICCKMLDRPTWSSGEEPWSSAQASPPLPQCHRPGEEHCASISWSSRHLSAHTCPHRPWELEALKARKIAASSLASSRSGLEVLKAGTVASSLASMQTAFRRMCSEVFMPSSTAFRVLTRSYGSSGHQHQRGTGMGFEIIVWPK